MPHVFLLFLVTCGHICDFKSNSLPRFILTHRSHSNLSSWIIAHILDFKIFWTKARKDTTRMHFLANFQTQLGLQSGDIWEMVRARCSAADQTVRNDFEISCQSSLTSGSQKEMVLTVGGERELISNCYTVTTRMISALRFDGQWCEPFNVSLIVQGKVTRQCP